MKNMYKFVKSITILFVMMGVLNGCEENGNSGDSEDDSGNYEYVDLGLPSGLKWATCNVGAENPEDYGDYFAWGETKTKDTYTADNNITNGLQIEDISGDSEYDAAAANWRGDWRMPILAECAELLEECKWEWIMQGGVYGYRVVGPNGNYIFLPSAGYRDGSSIFYEGECGHYWSSTPDNYEDADRADYLNFDREDCNLNGDKRYRGQSVRPVLGKGIVAPTVTTNEITEIKAHSAECGGNVTDDGGADVISRGVCWSTSSNPTIKDNHTTDGDGMGEFTSHIYGLEPNTTYYVRAYATNAVGTGYGEEMSFTTEELKPPTVVTNEVFNIGPTYAKCDGDVIDDGGMHVTSRGVCWSTSSNPTIKDNHTTDGDGMGEFTSHIYGLEPNTTYYVRAYATNELGTSYGDEKSFTTGEFVNHEYVDLGLPSGLKWATCNVGAEKPEDYGDYFAWGEIEPKGEYTDDNSVTDGVEMEDISGNPQYDAATANWGSTWRMPTEEECEELVDECTWQWTTQNGVYGRKVTGPNGNHIFLPAAGSRNGSSLNDAGEYGICWSSTPYSNDYYVYYLGFSSSSYLVSYSNRYRGRSVRPVSE